MRRIERGARPRADGRSRLRPDHARAGFTLVEVLAALVVTGAVVAVVLPFAGRLAARWWMGETAVEVADGWMQAVARLGDDLSQASPLLIQVNGRPVAAFRTGPGYVQLVRTAPAAAGVGRLETVRFEIMPAAAGESLVRRAATFGEAAFFREPAAPLGAATVLLEGPYRFHFEAVGADFTPQAPGAVDPQLPVAVRLVVSSRTGASAPPAPMLFPIAARTEPVGNAPPPVGTAAAPQPPDGSRAPSGPP